MPVDPGQPSREQFHPNNGEKKKLVESWVDKWKQSGVGTGKWEPGQGKFSWAGGTSAWPEQSKERSFKWRPWVSERQEGEEGLHRRDGTAAEDTQGGAVQPEERRQQWISCNGPSR